MRYAKYIIPRYVREVILEEREFKSHTIVLGKDRFQYKIGVKCTKKRCVHYKSKKGYTVHWKKFFTELPSAPDYGGAYGLAKAFFDDPEGLAGSFGGLWLGYPEN